MKRNNSISVFLLITVLCFNNKAQNNSNDSSFIKTCNEFNLKRIIYKNIVCYDFKIHVKNHLVDNKKGTKFYEIINHTFSLDTNEYYLIEFKKIVKQDTNLLKDFILIEFENSIDKTIIERPNKKSKGLEVLNFGYPDLKLASKGIIAINSKKKELFFISGYMFLDDFKAEFFKDKSFTNKDNRAEYIKIKYFNYSPYDIQIKDDYIIFKSQMNLSNNEFKYRVLLKKNKDNYIEGKLELHMP